MDVLRRSDLESSIKCTQTVRRIIDRRASRTLSLHLRVDDLSLNILPSSVSFSIRDLVSEHLPIEALGSIIWYLHQ